MKITKKKLAIKKKTYSKNPIKGNPRAKYA